MNVLTKAIIIISFLSVSAFSQGGPCSNIKAVDVLMKNSTYIAECDSLLVINKERYEQITKELIYYKDLYKDYQKLAASLDEKSNLMEDHINNLDDYITKQEVMVEKYRTLFVESDSLVDRSTQNTNRALKELKKPGGKCFFIQQPQLLLAEHLVIPLDR